ncbi:hypothetical protein OGR47_10355 [Methylocystis sp. MJC1]|uniref:hypothetical protein n=1 Tax=Methylocystis sp. MJC1 TaxID=2654282 RepID=UPI0013EC9DD7|nr:hypothetical protein [Methylocystis sp. MJC1]KAF2992246.1 hypothetical protein MJC1_00624 [Methylocystis sp. MJC1]MBU6527386.1 hypothetical protein [Methylocystis sp. MJC1]UZX10336.1 hypothetical protein OGR47_10355 [Methylocystis sp. MJC1]
MRNIVVIGVALVSLAGCATVVRGTTQTVAINTPGVTGATCTLNSSSIGSQVVKTPGVVSLAKGSSAVAIRCSKECYSDGIGTLASNTDSMAAGNVLAGGVIGLGVDAATGAMNQYAPQADIVMTEDGLCRASAPPPASKRRR